MTVDPTKTQFASAWTIDKIPAYSTPTDCYPTSVGIGISYSITGGGGPITYTLKTITNPYGKKCLTSMSWSEDGTNWYDQDDNGTDATIVACGCNANNIYFFFGAQYSGARTIYIQFAIDSPS
jgi:hypothetical protein